MLERYLLFSRRVDEPGVWTDYPTSYLTMRGVKQGINKWRRHDRSSLRMYRVFIVLFDPEKGTGTVKLYDEIKDPGFNG